MNTVSFRRSLVSLLLCIGLYAAILHPFTFFMKTKPVELKLGYIPSVKLMRIVSADQKQCIAALLVSKVLMYFGGLYQEQSNLVKQPMDYPGMSRILHAAVNIDPYNADAYYFAESFLVWDVKQITLANELLDYGMKYRTWDWYLPFFAGFNSGYFLKDFGKAAKYYQRAGELSGQQLHISLASRFMQEAGQTDHAIAYLSTMLKTTRNVVAQRAFKTRLEALQAVKRIEVGRDRFCERFGRLPTSIEELLDAGLLTERPIDPYGGKFYLRGDGKVLTTSNFAFAPSRTGEMR
jgi:hypothetical protein